ncbi:MAG: hypothetical protein B7733_21670 [Myxococcales bacterium FL481]|nr:MAG: hypothetical protein B7733_21670 [Myxococcales bacterium FL481]
MIRIPTTRFRRLAWRPPALAAIALGASSAACGPTPGETAPPVQTSPVALPSGEPVRPRPAPAHAGTPVQRPTVPFPETPAGRRGRALIDTLNRGDATALPSFVSSAFTASFLERVPRDEVVAALRGNQRGYPGLELKRVQFDDGHSLEAHLQSRVHGRWTVLYLSVAKAEPYGIESAWIVPSIAPLPMDQPEIDEAEMVRSAQQIVQASCASDGFSGAVLLAKGERVLLSHACGEASKRFHVDNTIDTKFNLGSMNKMFTAVSIAQLADRGALRYDDVVSKYIDESWLPKSITDKVTIHHLLTHTSGLGSYFNAAYQSGSRENFRVVDDYKPLVHDDRPAFEPGTSYRYSNTGMLLLGVVIEAATGQTYFDYVREHIYKSAGMEHSDSYAMDRPVENLAIGYVRDDDSVYGWRNNTFKHVIKGGPAGGGFSTVGDLHRFALALQQGRLVSADTRNTMWTDHDGHGYGYGFQMKQGPAGRVVGHSGGFPGISARLDIYADRGYVLAVLANYDHVASSLGDVIGDLIAKTPPTAVSSLAGPAGAVAD